MSIIIPKSFVIVSFLVYTCTATYVHTVYQHVPTTIPEHLKMRLARQSRDLSYFGTRVDQTTLSGEPLLANSSCKITTTVPGYVYMLKQIVIDTHKVNWGYFSLMPMCAINGSSIEVQLTPRTGWEPIRLRLFDRIHVPKKGLAFDKIIRRADKALYANVKASIVIEVLADSFQLHVNGNGFYKQTGKRYYPNRYQVGGPSLDIHQIIYRAATPPVA